MKMKRAALITIILLISLSACKQPTPTPVTAALPQQAQLARNPPKIPLKSVQL